MIVNVEFMEENFIQIKSGIKTCVDVCVKIQRDTVHEKKIMFGVLVGFQTCKMDKLYFIFNFLLANILL